MLKFFHDIGIYEKAAGDIESITEDDYYEIFLRGIACVAPVYEQEELGEDVCCGGHIMYHFSDPAIPEYYRLCRLYEYKHSVTPEENPYVQKADAFYSSCCDHTDGDFGAGYNDDVHIREIQIEICPERAVNEYELLLLVYDVLEYYRREAVTLKNELMRGPYGMAAGPAGAEGTSETAAPETRKRSQE
jgi:hypothetical protein